MPDQVGHDEAMDKPWTDGEGDEQAQVIIKTIDNCKDQNQLHGFFTEVLGVSELRLFLNRKNDTYHFVSR